MAYQWPATLGDDGLLFHASNRGYSFDPEAEGSVRRTTFGACDVVGCGVYQAPVDGSGKGLNGFQSREGIYSMCSASGRKNNQPIGFLKNLKITWNTLTIYLIGDGHFYDYWHNIHDLVSQE